MKLYLIRHGQSTGNVRNLWYGVSDLPLTELGREQARQVGTKLRDVPLAAAYTSPLSRARETAEIALSWRDVPVFEVPGLREQDMGQLETLSVEEIALRDPEYLSRLETDWVHVVPKGGEPFDTGLAPRVARALDAIVAKGEDCAVFAHNGPLCYALTYLLGLPIENCPMFYLTHGCYTLIEIDPAIWNVKHALLRKYNV